ncbi:hypothetical protein [Acaryochloris marina]|uniref:hypothetical protein n=1 Tax=Acaryochloris marina TaxID=155978 RepID=UPI001BB0D449|nr:hypothetical protein [Acaryochloris marina]QUY40566.1 hypothetical protein I1H34_14590 [Acaryochloris marina S15]
MYLPDNNQPLRKWLVICSDCYVLYQAEPGVVIGAWLGFSHNRQDIYQARIQMKTGSTKTVEMNQLISANVPIILVTPLNGLGQLKPISLVELQTNQSHFLLHPQRQLSKYQRYSAIGVSIIVVCVGLSIQSTLAPIIIVVVVSSLLVGKLIPKILRSKKHHSPAKYRLILEQRLIKQSDNWGEQLQQLKIELSKLDQANKRLISYSKDELFHIRSISNKPRKRQYFENKYHRLNELIEHYILAKTLIDTNIAIIQLTEEVPIDLIDQLSNFSLKIKHLDNRYQSIT